MIINNFFESHPTSSKPTSYLQLKFLMKSLKISSNPSEFKEILHATLMDIFFANYKLCKVDELPSTSFLVFHDQCINSFEYYLIKCSSWLHVKKINSLFQFKLGFEEKLWIGFLDGNSKLLNFMEVFYRITLSRLWKLSGNWWENIKSKRKTSNISMRSSKTTLKRHLKY